MTAKNNDGVNMIGHDNKFINFDIWKMFGNSRNSIGGDSS